MKELIEFVNKLQDVCNTLGMPDLIDLPQIVMVGSQSTGKSSVLESIVRIPILPRGTGIVTRCPLFLQLIKCPKNDLRRRISLGNDKVEGWWGEFTHKKEKFINYDKICEEIERRTVELAGDNKGIVEDAINLRIYSEDVVNLTLVDLPGITKVPVEDQPENIEEQIRNLVLSYIKNEKSLILAVSAANVDFANSESLKIAKEVDPQGTRTLAILTKLDLANADDIADTLKGKVIPVKLGIIGVVLRSQDDIKAKKSIDKQLASEEKFLKANYSKIAKSHGVRYLEQNLSDLLMNHIRKWLPEVKKELYRKKIEIGKILESCGSKVDDPCRYLGKVINSFVSDFCAIIDGTLESFDGDIDSNKEIVGGPVFREIFDKTFEQKIDDITPDVSRTMIITRINMVGGARPFVFACEKLVINIIRKHIELLRIPSIECIDSINQEMEKVIEKTVKMHRELHRFPQLNFKITEILTMMKQRQIDILKNLINQFIDIEKNSINTNHPQFSIENTLKTYEENVQIYSNNIRGSRLKKVEIDAEITNNLVLNYLTIIKTIVKDQIPKYVMFTLIDFMKKEIPLEFSSLYNKLEDLLIESEMNVKRRDEAQKEYEGLNEINQIFQDYKW